MFNSETVNICAECKTEFYSTDWNDCPECGNLFEEEK